MSSKKTIYYISRKQLPHKNSIEELFLAISTNIKKNATHALEGSTKSWCLAHYNFKKYMQWVKRPLGSVSHHWRFTLHGPKV